MKLDDGRIVEWFDSKRRVYCIDGVEVSQVTLAIEDLDAFTQLTYPEYWAEQKKRAAESRKLAEEMDKVNDIEGHLWMHRNKMAHVSRGGQSGIIWDDELTTVYGPERTFYDSLLELVGDGWTLESRERR